MSAYAVLLFGVITVAGIFGLAISVTALIPTTKDIWAALRR